MPMMGDHLSHIYAYCRCPIYIYRCRYIDDSIICSAKLPAAFKQVTHFNQFTRPKSLFAPKNADDGANLF